MKAKYKLPMVRQCGTCTQCCTLMGVKELNKPHAQACTHDSGHSCTIYEERPQSCRDFQCMWLEEPTNGHPKRILWESERPDRCGVMFYPTTNHAFLERTGIPAVVARGDFEKGRATIGRLARFALVILAHDDGKRELAGSERVLTLANEFFSFRAIDDRE